jgi:hypothetical protein
MAKFKDGSIWAKEIQKHISAQKFDKAGKSLAQLEQHANYIDLYPELNEACGSLNLREAFEELYNLCKQNSVILDFYKKVSNTIATSNTMSLTETYDKIIMEECGLPFHTNNFNVEHLKNTKYYNFALKHKQRMEFIFNGK